MLEARNTNLINILLIIYLLFTFIIKEYFNNLWFYSVYINIAITILLIPYIKLCKISYSLILILVSSYFLIQIFQREGFFGFITILPAIIFSYLIKEGLIKPGLILSIFFCVIFFYLYLLSQDITPEYFGESSRNAIGFILLSITTLYYLTHYFRNSLHSANILIPIIAFVFSIVAWGRSGIFFNFLFLLITFLIRIYNKPSKYFYLVLLILLFFGFIFLEEVILLINLLVIRWGNPLNDVRWSLYFEFMESFKLIDLLIGFNFNNTEIISNYDNNPHNSYFQIMASYGIGAVLILFLGIISILKNIFYSRWVFLFLFFPYLGMIFFDSGGFDDANLIIFILLILGKDKNILKKNQCHNERPNSFIN
jgi:hypothetical protein